MREIKFRAWDTPNKYMITHKELCLVPLTYDEVFKGKEGYPLMQYTGLLDKNGVEIYESDILKVETQNYIGTVKFEHGSFKTDSLGFGFDVFGHEKDYEVIGNIYENKELLEDK